jgi:hypothetical protein
MTHYERLGVRPDPSLDDIRDAFRRQARQTHPDLCRGTVDETRRAHGAFCALSNAYRELIDPDKRAAYDARVLALSAHRATGPPPDRPADLSSYYAEWDATREEIWNAPRNEFVRETVLHVGFLVLAVPVHVVLLRHAFARGVTGTGAWRALAGSVTVPLLGL